jgi:hypothetical protein
MEQNNNQKTDYELRREKKDEEQRTRNSKRQFGKIAKYVLSGVIIVGVLGGGAWFVQSQTNVAPEDILSRTGIHWHPTLSIFIHGEEQRISENIGIGGLVHQPIHTHDRTGVLHLESMGLVRRQDTTLARFFEIWGRKFTAECIFDFCNGEGGTLRMTVNGEAYIAFDQYEMKDQDVIEIRYE